MFYTFMQNNSGGYFRINDRVTLYVIVEANNKDQANSLAESLGIYFDGCDDGFDCPCCGDRWYPAGKYIDSTDAPMIYDETPEQYQDDFIEKGTPYCYVYLLDGRKVTFSK